MKISRILSLRSVWILLGLVVLVCAGAGIYYATRPGPKADEPPRGAAREGPKGGPAHSQPAKAVIDRPFKVEKPYVDENGRIINRNDCDGDGLPDDWEMSRYGTLKYDAASYMDAPRIDRPAGKTDPADTDGDTLPDAWERRHFGHLKFGRLDDPDADGYPNYVEYHHQKAGDRFAPTRPDLLDPKHRPKHLRRSPRWPRGAFTTATVEFWRKQDALREKLKARKAAVRSSPATKPAKARAKLSRSGRGE